MEKTNKKSKSSFIVLLAAILLCVAVVLGMGGYTYAKYISSRSVETQTANVAKWGYAVGVDSTNLFGDAYGTENGTVIEYPATDTVSVGVKANSSGSLVVAPGTTGSVTFSVVGSAEVRSKITIAANSDSNKNYTTVTLTAGSGDGALSYEPLKWTLKSSTDGSTYTAVEGGDGVSLAAIIEKMNGLSGDLADIAPNTSENLYYELSWAWAFTDDSNENSDLYDTILGAVMAGTNTVGPNGETISVSGSTATVGETTYTATTALVLDLTVTVEQIQGTNP